MRYSRALESYSPKKSRSDTASSSDSGASSRTDRNRTQTDKVSGRRLTIKVGSDPRPLGTASPRASAGAAASPPAGVTSAGSQQQVQPRWARPTVAHAVRQASMRAERELREARIRDRDIINRGKGKRKWVRPRTAKSMVGIPDPVTHKLASEILVNGTTDPAEHNIRVSSPVPGVAPLSVALEPAMARWGTEWGLRDKPAVPTGDANSALGVDMSPRKLHPESGSDSTRKKLSSSTASSPVSRDMRDGVIRSPGGRLRQLQHGCSCSSRSDRDTGGESSRGPVDVDGSKNEGRGSRHQVFYTRPCLLLLRDDG